MDLHRTSSRAPVCDAELSAAVVGPAERSPAAAAEPPSPPKPRYAHPDFEVRMAERNCEERELNALEGQITELWGHINAATAQFLALVAEFDRREGWAQHGMASCSQWLNWQCGIGRVAAREKVRVARALTSLPKIREAFGQGRLSYSKVRAITRVATAETEDTLLHIALNGTAAHVERTVRGFRRVVRELERGETEAVHERRYLDCRRESDGSVKIEARLPPEAGEMLLKALEAAEAEVEEQGGKDENARGCAAVADAARADAFAETPGPQSGRQEGGAPENVSAETTGHRPAMRPWPCAVPENVSAETPPRSAGQRRADALEHILNRFLAGKCKGSASGAHEVLVHIAHDALRNAPESSGAEFDNGHAVAVETARRLGCDGALVGVVEGEQGEPLAVGRRTRAVSSAIRRALRVRDGGCRFPGCDRSRFVHAHHIKHWADGGETSLNNLVTLCSQHHRQVHEGGYGVRVKAGEIQFTRPDGRVMPPAVMPSAGKAHKGCFRGSACASDGARGLAELNAARGLDIDAQTARCGWNGERMDYNIALDGLCWEAGFR